MVPEAGIWNAFGISTTMSGLMFQPFSNASGAGASLGLPAGAPASTQLLIVSISRVLETTLVGEVSVGRIGEPRRHLLVGDRGFDRARPRPRLLVGQERHRRDFARPMAGLTVLLQHRQHVLVERGARRQRRRRRCRQAAWSAVPRRATLPAGSRQEQSG